MNTDENLADLLTKPLSGPSESSLFGWFCIMYFLRRIMETR